MTDISELPELVAAIDLGSESSVVARVSTRTLKVELLRNDLSNEMTPMVLSFAAGHRSFGEVAVQLSSTNKGCSADSLLQFLDYSHRSAEERQGMDFRPLLGTYQDDEQAGKIFTTSIGDKVVEARAEQLLGMMLAKLASFSDVDGEKIPLALVVPDSFSDAQRLAVRKAAVIANLNLCQLVSRTEAAAMDYGTKRSSEVLDGSVVLIVDIGHGYSSAAVYSWEGKTGTCVSSGCVEGVGGKAVNLALYEALNQDCQKRKGTCAEYGSKGSIRLMNQVRKLKESLSAVPEASVTCESLVNDEDVTFKFTRTQLEEICEPVRERISSLIKEVLERCPEDVRAKLTACELIGGGMRVPLVKEAISSALGGNVGLQLTMDSLSAVATGAGFCAARQFQPEVGSIVRKASEQLAVIQLQDNGDEAVKLADQLTDLEPWIELEKELVEIDKKVKALHEAKNKLESKIFQIRNLAEGGAREHADLIDKTGCLELVNKFDDWLYDDEEGGGANESSDLSVFESKLAEFSQALEPLCGAYFSKLEEDRVKQEKEMEEQEKVAAAEREANGDNQDRDFRKLSKPDRMRKVVLNKDEGNELFKGGNIEAASLRYIRALQHCDKFFDLSPEDVKEVDAVKLSLHLNCAQCYLKLQKWPEAIKEANNALKIDPDSPKALYRLAYAQENKKEFDEAKKNLTRARELAPEDKSIERLLERVNQQIKREKLRAKKMAEKMFG